MTGRNHSDVFQQTIETPRKHVYTRDPTTTNHSLNNIDSQVNPDPFTNTNISFKQDGLHLLTAFIKKQTTKLSAGESITPPPLKQFCPQTLLGELPIQSYLNQG